MMKCNEQSGVFSLSLSLAVICTQVLRDMMKRKILARIGCYEKHDLFNTLLEAFTDSMCQPGVDL
jgi:hypothetical protein